MNGLIKSECVKLQRRKDFLFLATMLILPIFYAISIATHSSIVTYEGSERTTCFGFYSAMYIFGYMLMIYFIILSMTSIRSLRGEIENKSIKLYLQRVSNRKNLYLSKHIASISLFMMINIMFFIVSVICYYGLVIHRSDIAMMDFFDNRLLYEQVATVLSIFLYFIFMIFYSFMVSAYLKTGMAFGTIFLTIVVFSYLKEFPYLKYLSPVFYIQQLIDAKSTEMVDQLLLWMLLLILVMCLISYNIGKNKFERSDIP